MDPNPRPRASGFAVPARLHVFLVFMTQFIVMLAAFGGVAPTLHESGVNTALLILGSAVFLVLFHLVFGALARLLPVRCRHCGARARFAGFGWWPFIYRYDCRDCSQGMRFEVTG
jgi:hypothetical protein